MMNWTLAAIGLAIYFIGRYNNRKYKTKFNLKFWLKDNWPEAITSVLATIALMVIFMDETAEYNFDNLFESVGFIEALPVKKFISLLIGYSNSLLFYNLLKMKAKK